MSKSEKSALLDAFGKLEEQDRLFVLRLALSFARLPSSGIPAPKLLLSEVA